MLVCRPCKQELARNFKKKVKGFPFAFCAHHPRILTMSDPISNPPAQHEEDPELDDLLDGM
jgi:hypothetical protein